MRDLEWLNKKGYVLIIYNYKNFLNQVFSYRPTIVNGFAELILPWWQKEVEYCVVGGKTKTFNVYLVD
jgi:hypothetical protein